MIDLHSISFTYFETDQIKFAVQLCKAVKQAGGAEFDVLKFTKNWEYADAILSASMMANDDQVSQCAIELAQIRTRFAQQFPERAAKLGAAGAVMPVAAPHDGKPAGSLSAVPVVPASHHPDDADPPPGRYLKGLR